MFRIVRVERKPPHRFVNQRIHSTIRAVHDDDNARCQQTSSAHCVLRVTAIPPSMRACSSLYRRRSLLIKPHAHTSHSASTRSAYLPSSLLLLTLATLFTPGHSTTTSMSTTTSTPHPALLPRAHVIAPPSTHLNTIVFLHGLGDSSAGFSSVFESFPLPNTRVVLPNAPVQSVTANSGMKMPSWYDIYSFARSTPLNYREDTAGIHKSREAVDALLRSEVKLLQDAGRQSTDLIVGGFSQGGAMSIYAGLRYDGRLGGIVGLSCYLLLRDEYPAALTEQAKQLPIFMYHGQSDTTVPFDIGQLSYQKLKEYGLPVTFDSERGLPHSVSEDELAKVFAFIMQRFNASGSAGQSKRDL